MPVGKSVEEAMCEEHEDIIQAILELGASAAAVVKVSKVFFEPEFRKLCESNSCGNYGKSYMCPPDIGPVEKLIKEAGNYEYAIVYQTVSVLEDAYDFEGMLEAGARHNDLVRQVKKLPQLEGVLQVLHLGAGGCRLCPVCGKKTGIPCRYPETAISSLEAYGIDVFRLSKQCGMKYINGPNTVTYFGAVLTSAGRRKGNGNEKKHEGMAGRAEAGVRKGASAHLIISGGSAAGNYGEGADQ